MANTSKIKKNQKQSLIEKQETLAKKRVRFLLYNAICGTTIIINLKSIEQF